MPYTAYKVRKIEDGQGTATDIGYRAFSDALSSDASITRCGCGRNVLRGYAPLSSLSLRSRVKG